MFTGQKQFEQAVDSVIERNESILEMKSNITLMKTDITTMKSDITAMKGNITKIQSDMSKIQITMEQMQHNMGLMLENISTTLGLYPMVDYNKLSIEEIKARTEAIKAALQTHIRNRKIHLVR